MGINNYLTNKIKQKNPSHPIKFLESDSFSKKRYGMPSFHTQNMFFSIVYVFFILNNFIWRLVLLLIGVAVIYERYVFRDHTMEQLLYGALLGSLIGYIFYFIVKMI
jgi:membrane-associated phospholipid phosphatase